MSFFLLSVFSIKTIASIWINYVIIRFGADQEVRVRSNLMKSYQSFSYIEHMQRNSSEYIHYIQKLVDDYSDGVVKPLLKMTSDGIVSVAILGFIAWNEPYSFLVLFVFLSVITIGYDKIFKNKIYSCVYQNC